MKNKPAWIAVIVVLIGVPVATWTTSALTGKPIGELFFGACIVTLGFGIYFLVKLVRKPKL